MKKMVILYFILLNIDSYLFLNENESNIRFAFILSRTGAHSPSKLKQIKNEKNEIIYKDIFGYEWIGENELTSVGKRQQYYLGMRNNFHYNHKLYKDLYHPKELLAVSSQCNKTIQSSYANLHGIYQNNNIILTDKQVENAIPPLKLTHGYDELKIGLDENKYPLPNNIQIVPVHHFYEKDHTYLLEKIENCPKIKNFYDEGEALAKKKREEILNYKNENNNGTKYGDILIKILNEEKIFYDKYDLNYLINNATFFKLMAETFICDYFEAHNLDKFNSNGLNIYKLLEMFEEYFGEIAIGGGIKNTGDERSKKTLDLAQKVNYNLFSSLLSWTKERINNDIKGDFDKKDYNSPKIVLFLSHHESIESLYYFLKETFDLKNGKNSSFVNFTSFLGIELYKKNSDSNKNSEENYYIKIIYDNKQLGNDIDYNSFQKKLKEKTILKEDIVSFCGITKNDNIIFSNLIYKILGIILIAILVILIALSVYLTIKLMKNDFGELPEEILVKDDDDE